MIIQIIIESILFIALAYYSIKGTTLARKIRRSIYTIVPPDNEDIF
jgi:hypothetical protein